MEGTSCPICGSSGYATAAGHTYTCPNNQYAWPYSNKCPECGKRGMVGDKCTLCGESQHMETCPKCGALQNHRHFKKYGGTGCIRCKE